MNPQDIVTTTDHLSKQDDRWLMIASVVLLLVFMAVVIDRTYRHFSKQVDSLTSRLNELQDKQVEYIKGVGAETLKTLVASQDILKQCSTALTRNADLEEKKMEAILRLEEKVDKR